MSIFGRICYNQFRGDSMFWNKTRNVLFTENMLTIYDVKQSKKIFKNSDDSRKKYKILFIVNTPIYR